MVDCHLERICVASQCNGKEEQVKDKSQYESGLRSELKKEEPGFKKYIQEDVKLEEEGRTYGGLM